MRGSRVAWGIVLGLGAGLAFGAGGAIVKPLFEAGWSPGAAVFARICIGAALLTLPGLIALRFDLRPLWRAKWTVLVYGLIAVAGVQFAFYASLERIPVSTALLIEYLAPVALVLFAWLRTRHVPQRIVLVGSALSIAGLVLVIGPGGGSFDPLGIAFAFIAMIGVCVYYAIGERATGEIPPIALAAAGFVVGGVALGILGAVGLLPMQATFGEVDFLGGQAPWFAPLLLVGVVSTAFAYVAGIAAISILGSRLSAFLGLSEVVFAGVVGWILLGEALGPVQLVGGLFILGGIVCVKLERRAPDPAALALEIDLVPVTGSLPVAAGRARRRRRAPTRRPAAERPPGS